MMRWRESWRADPAANALAKHHYTCQSPDSDQYVPPGRCVCLVIPGSAVWVTSWPFAEFTKHAWAGAWVCSIFRNETNAPGFIGERLLSSELVIEALAATRFYWTPPPEGIITFVDASKTRRKRDPGRCFLKAGFHLSGGEHPCCADKPKATEDLGLVALHMAPWEMPAAEQPLGATRDLFGAALDVRATS